MAQLRYQPEIDGLRAIAVLSVVLYHAGFSLLGGGYVGVDVFFVISGYLITSLILREVNETGSFQFGRFYLRRIRRLVPALLSTVLASWIGGFLFLSPEQMQDFGASTLAALTSLSNIYFWFEADYFDAASSTKPLLHTWSLSVEEQFYLIWPALVVFGFAKANRAIALVFLGLLGAASLMLAEYWVSTDRDAAFYLLPARVVELGIGAALVWLPTHRIKSPMILEIGAFTGLAVIIWSIISYNHDTPFPGITALWPCLGTAAFIACSRARFAAAPLRLAFMVWVGKISYSLYLVHWPVIVFTFLITQTQPNTVMKWLIMGLSLVLGWLQYRFVESRFRHGEPGKDLRFAGFAGICAALIAVPSAAAYYTQGMSWRVPADRLIARTDVESRRHVHNTYCTSFAPEGTFAGDNRDIVTCQNFRGKKHDIYLFGDSHAQHLIAGLSTVYKNYNVYALYMNGCVPQSGLGGYVRDFRSSGTQKCVARNRKAIELLQAARPAHIIISSAKRASATRIYKPTRILLDKFANTDHRVIFLGDFIRPGASLANCVNVPAYALSDLDIARRCTGDPKAADRELRYNRGLARLMPEMVEVNDLQCFDSMCKFFHRGQLLYRDAHHLNEAGSIYFAKKLRSRLNISTKGWNARIQRWQKQQKLKSVAPQAPIPANGGEETSIDRRTTGSVSRRVSPAKIWPGGSALKFQLRDTLDAVVGE